MTGMRGKPLHRVLSLVILLLLLAGLSPPASAADNDKLFSDAVWRNGNYNSTLGDMAGRRLYVYGIVDSFAEMPDNGTDADLYLNASVAAGRLNAALYFYRMFGKEPLGECPFPDVPDEYKAAVAWLYEAGVIKGIGNNLFGVGSITEYQLLVMLSRYFDWETEDRETLYGIAADYGLLPKGLDEDVFSFGELYQILSSVLDRLAPERCVCVRQEMSIPARLDLTACSYEDAVEQIKEAVHYLPGAISLLFTENCLAEDISTFLLHFDWSEGDKELPIIGALDRSYLSPYRFSSYSERRFRLQVKHYSEAFCFRADAQDWFRVYEDRNYSAALRAFENEYLFPLLDLENDYERISKAHDLLCSLASYDYSEYYHQARSQSHKIFGLIENGEIVCDGYAKTFQWMLLFLGIDSYEVVGVGNRENHAWNKVLLDGKWYNVDTCWDDTGSDRFFLLKSDSFFEKHQYCFTDGFSKTAFASSYDY